MAACSPPRLKLILLAAIGNESLTPPGDEDALWPVWLGVGVRCGISAQIVAIDCGYQVDI